METLHLSNGVSGVHSLGYTRRNARKTRFNSFNSFANGTLFCSIIHKPLHFRHDSFYLNRRVVNSAVNTTGADDTDRNDHHHHQLDHSHHHHHHDHSHHHHHHHHGNGEKLTRFQEAVFRFAKAIGWADLANLLRQHLELCCCSTALLLAGAACPYLIPKSAVKPLQNVFVLIAFPLVGVRLTIIFILSLDIIDKYTVSI